MLALRVTEKAQPLKAVPKHMVVGDLTNEIGRFLWSRDHRIARIWRREWPAKLALVRALPFVVTSVTHDGYTIVGNKLKGRWYTIHFIS